MKYQSFSSGNKLNNGSKPGRFKREHDFFTTIVCQLNTPMLMFSTKPDKYMQASCIGWKSPTSDFKWHFQTMAGLVGKEDVFAKQKKVPFGMASISTTKRLFG
jgi:hypothetical protein